MQKVQSFISNNDITEATSLETVLKNVNVNLNEYTEALKVSQKGTNIILKCNIEDVFTNACNVDILCLWGRNMDLQPVVDDVGAVMYVCSYMTKGEKAMGETLKRVSKECKNDDIHTQMKKNQERISRQKGVWNTKVHNANPINVADEEEYKSNMCQHRNERTKSQFT